MTDSEYEATKQKIIALADKWQEALGLKWWRIKYVYYREGIPGTEDSKYAVLGQASVKWEYQHGTIEFNVMGLAAESDEQVERVVVHELMHVFLNEARETGKDWLKHEERVASSLTDAFIWVRDTFGKGETQKDTEA